jgi:hypothetical protein
LANPETVAPTRSRRWLLLPTNCCSFSVNLFHQSEGAFQQFGSTNDIEFAKPYGLNKI